MLTWRHPTACSGPTSNMSRLSSASLPTLPCLMGLNEKQQVLIIMCPFKRIVQHPRASCLVRTRRCLNTIFLTTLHLSQFIHTFHLAVTTQYHQIHGQQDCLVVWPCKVRSHVMSPTPSWRSAAQRLLPFTDHQGGRVFAQYTIPVRTSHLRPCLRKWMRDKASEGQLHPCSYRKERSKCNRCENLLLLKRKFSITLITYSKHGETCCDTHTRKPSRDRRSVQEKHLTSERIRSEQQEVRDFLKFRRKPCQASLKWNFIRVGFLKSKGGRYSSEARSEMNMQESRASEDVIRELNSQIHSHRMEIHKKTGT